MAPETILNFWFEESEPKYWFQKSEVFDAQVKDRFLAVSQDNADKLAEDGVHPWEASAQSALALLLTLDQFSRNMFRGDAKSFAWDDLARAVAERMIANGFDLEIAEDHRAFVYMPFMHGEDMASQNQCVELCEARLIQTHTLSHAKSHRALIARFGRFPHRNKVLGRVSTLEELEFLESGGYAP